MLGMSDTYENYAMMLFVVFCDVFIIIISSIFH